LQFGKHYNMPLFKNLGQIEILLFTIYYILDCDVLILRFSFDFL